MKAQIEFEFDGTCWDCPGFCVNTHFYCKFARVRMSIDEFEDKRPEHCPILITTMKGAK